MKKIFMTIFCLIALTGCVNTSSDYPEEKIIGNPDADVVVEEFSDLQCPACGAASKTVTRILDEFGEKIQFHYYHFPLEALHENAFHAAEAASCAADQGKFKEYIDIAFENNRNLRDEDLKKYASKNYLELDTKAFNKCLDSGAKKDDVKKDMNKGYSLNIQGTPTFFINGKMLPTWQYEYFKQEIRKALEQNN